MRVRSTAYDRAAARPARRSNYVTYLGERVPRRCARRSPDLVLCMTDPPMVGDSGSSSPAASACRCVVISQDVFPEIAVELRRLENPVARRPARSLIGSTCARADRVVAIGETMQRRLEEKGAPRTASA